MHCIYCIIHTHIYMYVQYVCVLIATCGVAVITVALDVSNTI